MFVACDGPNPDRPGEAEKVAATRSVIEEEIDWPHQIERLYACNQGCCLELAVHCLIFDHVERIILEDDCVPHPDFFLCYYPARAIPPRHTTGASVATTFRAAVGVVMVTITLVTTIIGVGLVGDVVGNITMLSSISGPLYAIQSSRNYF